MRGVVTKILFNKGFGFIRDERGQPRFMHANEVVPRRAFDALYEGQPVEFDPIDIGDNLDNRGNGLRAVNIRPLETGVL